MMRVAISILLSFVLSIGFAQKSKRANYNLLWRISGNGLSKPSYLFGTMHVQDNRVFNFNDSLLAKLIQCEAFAMEVHPDSTTRFFASVVLEEHAHQSIESQMTAADFRHYDSLMKKQTGLSLTKFKNVREAISFVEYRGMRRDKSTFLDAWLYNIAREKNKRIAGLERTEVQMELFQQRDSVELRQFKACLDAGKFESNDQNRSLLDIYHEGDIETIFEFTKSNTSPDRFKKVIIDRNLAMTASIIGEIHQQTTFVAVGAAHLGGTPGIVNLLRAKGYVLTPVSAPFSGTASRYKSSSTTGEKWFVFSSDEGGYSVEMPQAPVPLKMKELPFSFQTYFDIGTLSVFMAAHLPVGVTLKNQSSSKVLDAIVKNMEASHKLSANRKITIDGCEGRELEAVMNGAFFRVRVVIKGANVYMLMVGPSKESVNTPEARRFLSSLKMKAPVDSDVTNFVDKPGAFAANMPGSVATQVLTPADPTSGREVAVNIFYSADNSTGAAYIVRYNDFPTGYVCSDDSVYIHNTLHAVYEGMNGVNLSADSVDFHGMPSTHFEFSNAGRTVKTEGILLMRGERLYLVMNSRASNDGEQAAQSFFNSFRFLPYETPELKKVTFPDGITLEVPKDFASDSTLVATGNTKQYAFTDRLSGMMFIVLNEALSAYDHADNEKDYFKKLGEEYHTDKGMLLNDSIVAPLIHDYLLQSDRSNAIIKIRAVIAGQSVITLLGYLPHDYQKNALANKIFGSLHVTSKSNWSLFSDKADVILNDLNSSDSTTRAKATAALQTYDFKTNHLPKVYEGLKRSYVDDGSWYGIRTSLLDVLHTVRDGSTEEFIEALYPSLPDSTSLKEHALEVLSSIKTVGSTTRMIRLLSDDRSGHRFNSYHIVNPLIDSLPLVNEVALPLLNNLPKFQYSSRLFDVIRMALDSNAISTTRRPEVISALITAASGMADRQLKVAGDEYQATAYNNYAMVEALSAVPFTPQVDEIIRKFASEDDDDIKFACIQVQLKNNVTTSQADIDRLSSQHKLRLSLYEALGNYGKRHLMNKKYQTPEMLAAGEVYEVLSAEDETPEKIDFLKEKKVIVNGEKKKILVFTFRYSESDEPYIAIAGPYSIGAAFQRGDLTGSFYDKYENEKQLKEKLAAYLNEHDVTLVD